MTDRVLKLFLRFLTFLGALSLTALVGLGVSYAIHRLRPAPPPITVQLSSVIRDAAQAGFRVKALYSADLKGTGEQAKILVLTNSLVYGAPGSLQAPSDELRIYDVVGGRLRRRFDFHAQIATKSNDTRTLIELRRATDLDGNGTRELVFGVSLGPGTHPAAVVWNPSRGYQLVPLLRPPFSRHIPLGYMGDGTPRLVELQHPGAAARQVRSFYLTPAKLFDPTVRHNTWLSYPTDDFIIARSRSQGNAVLVGAFTVRPSKLDPLLQLNAWTIAPTFLGLTTYACGFANPTTFHQFRPVLFHVPYTGSVREALHRVWRQVGPTAPC